MLRYQVSVPLFAWVFLHLIQVANLQACRRWWTSLLSPLGRYYLGVKSEEEPRFERFEEFFNLPVTYPPVCICQIKVRFLIFLCLFSAYASSYSFLAQVELSTSPQSHCILPRSVYLFHWLSFHALGKDYHTLTKLRRLEGKTDGKCRLHPDSNIDAAVHVYHMHCIVTFLSSWIIWYCYHFKQMKGVKLRTVKIGIITSGM